jgi:hypothetical protein
MTAAPFRVNPRFAGWRPIPGSLLLPRAGLPHGELGGWIGFQTLGRDGPTAANGVPVRPCVEPVIRAANRGQPSAQAHRDRVVHALGCPWPRGVGCVAGFPLRSAVLPACRRGLVEQTLHVGSLDP